MKINTLLSALFLFASFIAAEDFDQSPFTLSATRVIKTGDRLGLTQKILVFTESVGGYFVFQNKEKVELKIPLDFVDSSLAFLDSCGLILEKSYQRDDLTETYWQHVSRLNAKRGLLKDFLKMLENAGDTGIFAVEQSVISLQKEIEEEQGSINKIKHQARYADVTVLFNLPNVRTPLADGTSNFPWLNSVNLSDVLREYMYEY